MNMKTLTITVFSFVSVLLSSCSNEQSIEKLLEDPEQQEIAINTIINNHDLAQMCIDHLMDDEHARDMMLDAGVAKANTENSVGEQLNAKISQHPDLVMLTVHHLIPVVELDDNMCEGFCEHTMNSDKIMNNMCDKMDENQKMSCCH